MLELLRVRERVADGDEPLQSSVALTVGIEFELRAEEPREPGRRRLEARLRGDEVLFSQDRLGLGVELALHELGELPRWNGKPGFPSGPNDHLPERVA